MLEPIKKKVAAATDFRVNVPLIALKDLLKGGKECMIEHRGENYNLRLTRNNKLILTK